MCWFVQVQEFRLGILRELTNQSRKPSTPSWPYLECWCSDFSGVWLGLFCISQAKLIIAWWWHVLFGLICPAPSCYLYCLCTEQGKVCAVMLIPNEVKVTASVPPKKVIWIKEKVQRKISKYGGLGLQRGSCNLGRWLYINFRFIYFVVFNTFHSNEIEWQLSDTVCFVYKPPAELQYIFNVIVLFMIKFTSHYFCISSEHIWILGRYLNSSCKQVRNFIF